MRETAIIFYLSFFLSSFAYPKNILSPKEYLSQVTQQGGTYRAADIQARAFQLKEAEASLDFMPQLLGGVNYQDDKRIPLSPLFGTETVTGSANLGVQTKLRTGTLVNFTYTSAFTQVFNSTFYPSSALYTDSPAITLTQPLWKDFNAHLSKANEQALEASYRAQGLQQKYLAQQISFNAETAYWRLALLRQINKFDKESLERTDKILAWNKRRVSMNVADRADLLQAEAAYKLKMLQSQSDAEALRQAASQFNSLRNIRGDVVEEELSSLDPSLEAEMLKELKRTAERTDVAIALSGAQAAKAQADAAVEKTRPDISLFGTVQFNGRGLDNPAAAGESWNPDNPLYAVGLKLSVPLDFSLISDIKQGYRAAAQAAEIMAQRTRFDLDQDWHDLQKKFLDVLDRFKIAKELEVLQKEKLDHERTRFKNGRTTSFQVLQFEDNFSDAQLARLRLQNDIITLRAQARLYNGETL